MKLLLLFIVVLFMVSCSSTNERMYKVQYIPNGIQFGSDIDRHVSVEPHSEGYTIGDTISVDHTYFKIIKDTL